MEDQAKPKYIKMHEDKHKKVLNYAADLSRIKRRNVYLPEAVETAIDIAHAQLKEQR
jgi:hypothetical protein